MTLRIRHVASKLNTLQLPAPTVPLFPQRKDLEKLRRDRLTSKLREDLQFLNPEPVNKNRKGRSTARDVIAKFRFVPSDDVEKIAQELRAHPEKIPQILAIVFGKVAPSSGHTAATADTAPSIVETPEPATTSGRRETARQSWPTLGQFAFEGVLVQPPDKAPALWQGGGRGKESIVDFLSREYGEFIGKGFNRAQLGKLDKAALGALRDFETSRRVRWLPIPTLPDYMDGMSSWIDRVGVSHAKSCLGEKEVSRIRHAVGSRPRSARTDGGHSPETPPTTLTP